MSMIDTRARLPLGTITAHRIASFVSEMVDRYDRWAEHRRTVAALRRLDNRQLEDIGLTPGDIDSFERLGRF